MDDLFIIMRCFCRVSCPGFVADALVSSPARPSRDLECPSGCRAAKAACPSPAQLGSGRVPTLEEMTAEILITLLISGYQPLRVSGWYVTATETCRRSMRRRRRGLSEMFRQRDVGETFSPFPGLFGNAMPCACNTVT